MGRDCGLHRHPRSATTSLLSAWCSSNSLSRGPEPHERFRLAGQRGAETAPFALERFAPPLLAALLLASSAAVHVGFGTVSDVSWLITVDEKWLSGATPYRDVIEVNPPASLLLYWPAVALAQLTNLTPELCVADVRLWRSKSMSGAGGEACMAEERTLSRAILGVRARRRFPSPWPGLRRARHTGRFFRLAVHRARRRPRRAASAFDGAGRALRRCSWA